MTDQERKAEALVDHILADMGVRRALAAAVERIVLTGQAPTDEEIGRIATKARASPADAWLDANREALVRDYPDEEVIVDLATGEIVAHSQDYEANGIAAERYEGEHPGARIFHVPVALLVKL